MSALRKAALKQGELAVVIMAEIETSAGTGYFWSGLGDLDYGGNVYHGYGSLVSISQVATSTDIEVVEVRFVLSGVDADLLADLDQSVKGHAARVYEACLDADYRVIYRALLVEADLDYRVYAVGADGKATIALVAQAGFPQLLNRSGASGRPRKPRPPTRTRRASTRCTSSRTPRTSGRWHEIAHGHIARPHRGRFASGARRRAGLLGGGAEAPARGRGLRLGGAHGGDGRCSDDFREKRHAKRRA